MSQVKLSKSEVYVSKARAILKACPFLAPQVNIASDSGMPNWLSKDDSGLVSTVNGYDIEVLINKVFLEDTVIRDYQEIFGKMLQCVFADEPSRIIKQEDILPIAFKSQTGLTWHKLSWDVQKDVSLTQIPEFEDFISRCHIGGASLMQWVGSLFDQKSTRHQYVHMYGEGSDGKSTFIDMLESVLSAKACVRTGAQLFQEQSGGSDFEGKRLVVFQDENNTSFSSSSKFKQLTGDKFLPVRAQYEKAKVVPLSAKVLISSNHKLNVKNDTANMRRVLPVQIRTSPTTGDAAWGARFIASAPLIISYCIQQWEEYKASTGQESPNIVADQMGLVEIESQYEDTVLDYVERVGVIEKDAVTLLADFVDALSKIGVRDNRLKKEINDFLEKKGVQRVRKGANKLRYIVGFKLKINSWN